MFRKEPAKIAPLEIFLKGVIDLVNREVILTLRQTDSFQTFNVVIYLLQVMGHDALSRLVGT